MSYLILNDFYSQIQIANLASLIGADQSKLTSAASKAQEECESYLLQKYDVSAEFTDTAPWVFTASYTAAKRVYLDATAYDPTVNYSQNQLTLQSAIVYKANQNITTPEAFNPAHWDTIGPQYTMYFAVFPKPLFDQNAYYKVGSQVFWKDRIYTALIQTPIITDDVAIQYAQIANLPLRNIFPDDPLNGAIYWGAGVAYLINANTAISNTVFWEQGDNRSQQLLEIMIDIALYKVHKRIAPRNIPELRVKAYDDAVIWLKQARGGEVTANLPVIQPIQGRRIRYGGNIKNINSY